MKNKKFYTGAILIALLALSSVSFKCPQKVYIVHFTGSGAQIIHVSVNSLQGHANHGDLYLSSGCWVGDTEWACR